MEALQGVSIVAVVAATAGSFGIGFLWYSVLFGNTWAKLTGADMNNKEGIGRMMLQNQAFNIVGITIFYYLLVTLKMPDLSSTLLFTFLLWASFTLPSMMATIIWQRRKWMLGAIDTSAYLAQSLVVATILSFWL